MPRSGKQPEMGEEEVGAFIQDSGVGGGRHTDLQHLLQGSCAVDPFFLIVNLGDDPH